MAANTLMNCNQSKHQGKVYQNRDIYKKELEIVKRIYHHLAIRGEESNMSEIKRLMQLKERKDILENGGDAIKCFMEKYSDVFMVSKDFNKGTNVLQAVVKIEFCKTFDSKQGCGEQACPKLHVCRHFIKGKCTFGSKCKKPHHFEGAHTRKILREHLLDGLTHAQLKEFLCRNVQFALEDTVDQANLPKQLEICKYYNVAIGCSREGQCPFLHVCRFYAEEGTCKFGQKCIRKHDVCNEHARKLLARYDVHESQIWPYLRKNTNQNFGCIIEDEFSPTELKISHQRAFSNITNLKQNGQKQRTKSSSHQENPEKCRQLISEPVRKFSDPVQREFLDVKQEICERALNDMCIDSMYCTKIHHKFPFSWQHSQNGKFWHNFSLQENLKIETKFVDVCQNGAIVSLDDHHEFVLDFSRGTAIQKSHSCILRNGIYNALPNIVQIRRLSTPSSVNSVEKDSNFLTRWIWYYLDDRNNWQSYDDDDDDDDGCNQSPSRKTYYVNCAAIEIAYLDPRRNSFQFKRGGKNFIIDFTSMLQQEVETKIIRDVRRRPAKVTASQFQQEPVRVENTAAEKSFFPSYWQIAEIGIPGDFGQCKLLKLDAQSREYVSVLSDFQRSMKNCRIEKIMAVQNPRLWMTYAMKREKLAEINACNAEEKMLYRVASLDMAVEICQNGFEASNDSHHGLQVKEAPYFAREARLANRNNKPNANGYYVVFLCKVLISACTTSRLGMKEALIEGYRPSDDLSMYYVFDQDQVYPEFLVLFRY